MPAEPFPVPEPPRRLPESTRRAPGPPRRAPDPLAFRRAAGRFATGVTVVTTCYDGADHGMTVNSFTSVSLDPLLVLFCCEKETRFHPAVLGSGRWAVSVLGAGQRAVSQWFAFRGRPFTGQFDRVPHRRGAASGALLLTDALAILECRTVATYEGGDHTIVLGDVEDLELPRPDAPPLLYVDGDYRSLRPPR